MPSAGLLLGLIYIAQCVTTSYPLVTRSEWGAQPPAITPLNMTSPVLFVVVHHSYVPSACNARDTCCEAMRAMQRMHQVVNGWNDIGYNFAVGGDESVYEGRGWDVVGAHAPKYNFMSVGICFIGDYRTGLPSAGMLQAARQLILEGVDRGSIHPNYTLVGHRQVRETECPGGALFQEIQSWLHWKPVKDIQPRGIVAVARPNITDNLSNSTNTGLNVTDNLLDRNNGMPNVTDSLLDNNNDMPNATDNLSGSNNNGIPNVMDNLSDSNNGIPNVTGNLSDSNNDIPYVTDNLSDSNNDIPNDTDNLSDSNNDMLGVTANLTDSNSSVYGLPL